MRKRNSDFGLSREEVMEEYLKSSDSHSKHHSHHHSEHDGNKHHDDMKAEDTKLKDNKHRGNSKKKKKSVFSRIIIIIVAVLFFLAILGGGAVLIMHRRGKNEINKKKENVTIQTIDNAVSYDESGKTVEYKGQKYIYNEDILTFAFLGIDDKSFGVTTTDKYGKAGQADTIMVFAYDTKKGNVSIITIPRDSMTDVDVYSESGNFARTEKMQICLSFAYGNGKESSCENVIKSIERVLLGVPINSYFSLRTRGVDALNSAVGGIELVSLETFGPFVKGQKVHLTGDMARNYCVSRDSTKIDSDSFRRERQMQYIKAYASKVMELAKNDIGIVTKLYNTAKQYTVTDISLSSAIYVASELLSSSAEIDKITSLKGEYINADTYPQYILNEEYLYETILEIFYDKI